MSLNRPLPAQRTSLSPWKVGCIVVLVTPLAIVLCLLLAWRWSLHSEAVRSMEYLRERSHLAVAQSLQDHPSARGAELLADIQTRFSTRESLSFGRIDDLDGLVDGVVLLGGSVERSDRVVLDLSLIDAQSMNAFVNEDWVGCIRATVTLGAEAEISSVGIDCPRDVIFVVYGRGQQGIPDRSSVIDLPRAKRSVSLSPAAPATAG